MMALSTSATGHSQVGGWVGGGDKVGKLCEQAEALGWLAAPQVACVQGMQGVQLAARQRKCFPSQSAAGLGTCNTRSSALNTQQQAGPLTCQLAVFSGAKCKEQQLARGDANNAAVAAGVVGRWQRREGWEGGEGRETQQRCMSSHAHRPQRQNSILPGATAAASSTI